MIRNQHCRTMSLLIGMFLMATMMLTINVAAYTFNELGSGEESDYKSSQRLRHLLRKLQRDDDDEELFFESRAEPVGDCTSDIIDGYRYSGTQSSGFFGILTAQRCMDKCDVRANCMGWSYEVNTKLCWFHSTITGITAAANVKSGSCIGTSIKKACTEQRDGQYYGIFDPTLSSIVTVKDCMTRCDQSPTCFSWIYGKNGKVCYLSRLVGQFVQSTGFISGSCLAPQRRIKVADPIKIFRLEALDRHNEKRKLHCSLDLTLNENLNTISQNLANKLAAADVIPPVYSTTSMQTVYFTKADYTVNGAIPVDCFYDENTAYNWDTPDFSSTNHFPKIIWKSSKTMGVGRAMGVNNITMYIVITYDWQGNIATSYKANVPKKCT